MPDLVIRIKKKTDGSAALSCTRADGSVTWQRQEGQLGRFFPLHDLTHFAVESVLGFRGAFFGLIAQGWDISDFAKPGAAAKTPEEGFLAETIVGAFDLERATGVIGDAADINEKIRTHRDATKQPPTDFRITDADVIRIREVRAEVFARWRALPAGDAMEVVFDRAPVLPQLDEARRSQ